MTTLDEFTFPSADGKTSIAAFSWEPDSTPKAVLQIAHGMQEHIERYHDFACYLAERGFLVVGNNHLGHKGSVTADADLGYFGDKPSDLVVADMHALRQLVQGRRPSLPYFMLGHSMGSFMLRKYLASHGQGLAGAIVMGTGFTPEATTRAGLALIGALSRVRGPKHVSDQVAALAFGDDYKPYDMTGAEPGRSWLSHNVENVKAYYADPYCGFPFTLNGYQGLMEAVQFSCNAENAEKVPAGLPLLFVSGELDPVGGAGQGVLQAFQLYVDAGVRDARLKLYPHLLHEILNEPMNAQVHQDLAEWMEERLGA